jgi:hypothetical protein
VKIPVIYVSVWDSGNQVRTDALYNPVSGEVTDIVMVDVTGVQVLDKEYIELPNGEELLVTTDENGNYIVSK